MNDALRGAAEGGLNGLGAHIGLRHRDGRSRTADAERIFGRRKPHPEGALERKAEALIRSAKIWDDLDKLGIPGIKGVYSHPAAAGGFGMTVISIEQRHAGHAAQVLALAAQVPGGGAYYTKWIIAVDDDIDPRHLRS